MIAPSEFLLQARKLVGDGKTTSEVDCRSAISRAYYSLFHEARESFTSNHKQLVIDEVLEVLRDKGKTNFDSTRVSSLEWDYLQRLGVNAHSVVHKVLRRFDKSAAMDFNGFRDSRNVADYELGANLRPHPSKTEVEAMEKLIDFLGKLRTP